MPDGEAAVDGCPLCACRIPRKLPNPPRVATAAYRSLNSRDYQSLARCGLVTAAQRCGSPRQRSSLLAPGWGEGRQTCRFGRGSPRLLERVAGLLAGLHRGASPFVVRNLAEGPVRQAAGMLGNGLENP